MHRAYLFPCLYTTDTYLTVQEMKNCTGTQSKIMDVLGFEQDRELYRNNPTFVAHFLD